MSKAILYVGEEVFKLMDTPEFVKSWKQLAKASTGFTLLQEPEYVTTWYHIYRSEYDPVLSVVFGEENDLLALMALAWEKKQHVLTHAGHDNAEYHGWLAVKDASTKLIHETIELVQERFALKSWTWRWLAPGLSDAPFLDLSPVDTYASIERRPSLIWNLKDPEKLIKLKKSRSVKYKFKRFQKRGNLQFKVSNKEEEIAKVLEVVKYQSDFRQEAINNALPFADNPHKIAFHLALLKYPEINHISGLWLDDQILAYHLGICDGKRVCLGVMSFDPSESKDSPGTLLMIELAQELTSQGIEIFDLTPGTDRYKERFGNGEEDLFRLKLYFSPRARISGRLKHVSLHFAKDLLPIFRIDVPAIINFKNNLKVFPRKIKNIGVAGMLGAFGSLFFSRQRLYIYQGDFGGSKSNSANGDSISWQQYPDLMTYGHNKPWLTRRDLLREALTKFSRGENLLSVTDDKELQWLTWQTNSVKAIDVRGFPKSIVLAEDQLVLYDFYCSEQFDKAQFNKNLERSLIQSTNGEPGQCTIILESRYKLSDEMMNVLEIQKVRELTAFRLFWLVTYFREKEQVR